MVEVERGLSKGLVRYSSRRRLDRLTERMIRGVWRPFEEEIVEPLRFRSFPVDVSETEEIQLTDGLQILLNENRKIYAVNISNIGKRIDIGSPSQYFRLIRNYINYEEYL